MMKKLFLLLTLSLSILGSCKDDNTSPEEPGGGVKELTGLTVEEIAGEYVFKNAQTKKSVIEYSAMLFRTK